MNVIVLAPSDKMGQEWQYGIEDLGTQWRCRAALSMEQAMALLTEWTDVLLLLPGQESRNLLRRLKAAPLLAPPFVLGEQAPDGPLPASVDLPAVLSGFRREGRLPVLSAHHLSAAVGIASALLRALGMPRRLRAWTFLPELLALTVVHPPLLHDLQHGLYPLIAAKYGMTAAGVERSLRLCVESIWTHGSLAAMERFFGSSVDPERGKPTNREFLCRIAERLTLTMRRLM